MFSLRTIVVFLVIILILHFSAVANSLYWFLPWLDIPMHILGGAWVAMLYFWLYPKNKSIVNCLSFVALLAVFWEFAEFFVDHLPFLEKFGSFQGDVADTMGDLFFSLLGGLIMITIDKIWSRNIIEP